MRKNSVKPNKKNSIRIMLLLSSLLMVTLCFFGACPTDGDSGGGSGKKTKPDVIDLEKLKAGEYPWGKVTEDDDAYLLIVKKAAEIQGTMDAAKKLVIEYVENVKVTVNGTIKATEDKFTGDTLIELTDNDPTGAKGKFVVDEGAEITLIMDNGIAIYSDGPAIEILGGTITANGIDAVAIKSDYDIIVSAKAAINGKVDGALKVANDALLTVKAAFDTIVNNLTIEGMGTAAVEGTGVLTNEGNTIYNHGTIAISAGGTLLNKGAIYNYGTINNNGIIDNTLGTIYNIGSGSITGSGTITGNPSVSAIGSAVITVTAPTEGDAPDTTAAVSGTVNFNVSAVTWSPNPITFTAGQKYTATVTLTAIGVYEFTPILTATINGQSAIVTNNTGVSITISYEFTAISHFTGLGTEGDPYIITTPEQLAQLATFVNAGRVPYANTGVYYKLGNDIDLSGYNAANTSFNSGKGWIPIGTEANPFKGNFDGDYCKVSGLYINNSTLNYAGLFGVCITGSLKKLGVEGTVTGNRGIGGLVGATGLTNTSNKFSITNCYANVTVAGNMQVGGLVGIHTWGSTITNCYATGNVTGTGTGAEYEKKYGGLVGCNYQYASINNCYATGNVTGTFTGTYNAVGGLVGNLDQTSVAENCYATGNVTGTGSPGYIGGVIAENGNYSSIINCVAANAVISGTGSTSRITIIGYAPGAISNNHAFDGMSVIRNGSPVSVTPNINGAEGADITITQLKTQATYSGTGANQLGWSFGADDDHPWKMGNSSYPLPVLYWQDVSTYPELPEHLFE